MKNFEKTSPSGEASDGKRQSHFSILDSLKTAFREILRSFGSPEESVEPAPKVTPFRHPPSSHGLTSIPPYLQENLQLREVFYPPLPRAALLLECYQDSLTLNARKKSFFWKELQADWAREFPDIPLPDIARDQSGILDFKRPYQLLVEDFSAEGEGALCAEKYSLLALLYAKFPPGHLLGLEAKCEKMTRSLYPIELQELLRHGEVATLLELGLDPAAFRILAVPYEVLLLEHRPEWQSESGVLINQVVARGSSRDPVVAGIGKDLSRAQAICSYSPQRHLQLSCTQTHGEGMVRLAIVGKT